MIDYEHVGLVISEHIQADVFIEYCRKAVPS